MIRWTKSRALRVGAFVALVSACMTSGSKAAGQRRATITREELRKQLIESHARISAWYVEFESSRERPTSESKGAYSHRVVAAVVPDRFFHWSTHGTSWTDWREDPYQQRLILNPSVAVIERPFHRQFRLLSLARDARLPGTMPQEFLFLALGWWPFPNRPPPMSVGGASSALPAIAGSPKYVLNPRQELVQGRWCHILEYPGHDRLWLDCGRGCAIPVREVFDPDKATLLQRIESREYREILPGIWVPFEFRNMLFDVARSKSKEGDLVKTLDATLNVLEVRLNEQVQDDLFRFKPIPGSIQSIGEDRIEQAVPGGADYLDEVIDWIQHNLDFPAIPAHGICSATEAFLEYSILIGGVLALVGLLFRRIRNPGNKPRSIVSADDLTASRETRA